MWAVEARSRPYGAGRAVEAASDRTLRRGYRGAPIALRGSDGHAKPPSNAQRFSLVGRLGLSAVPRRPPAHTSPVRRQSRGPSRPLRLGARWRASALATAPRVPALSTRSPHPIWPIGVLARRARATPTPAVASREPNFPKCSGLHSGDVSRPTTLGPKGEVALSRGHTHTHTHQSLDGGQWTVDTWTLHGHRGTVRVERTRCRRRWGPCSGAARPPTHTHMQPTLLTPRRFSAANPKRAHRTCACMQAASPKLHSPPSPMPSAIDPLARLPLPLHPVHTLAIYRMPSA